MAKVPYTSEILSRKIATDLATRLYQFMQVNKLIDSLKLLNGSKQNDEDIKALREELNHLYTGYIDNSLENDEEVGKATEVFKDEELLDTIDKIAFMDSEKEIAEQLHPFIIQKMSSAVISKTQGYHKIDDNSSQGVELSLNGTLFTVLDKENSKIDAEDVANRIVEGRLQAEEIPAAVNALQAAKQKVLQRMKADWQTYESEHSPNPNIEVFRDYFEATLTESKDFHYKTYPETRNVLLCIRDDFADKETGSKTAFLKMAGYMLDCGYKQLLSPASAKVLNNNNYKDFIALIKHCYPENSEQVINTLLEVDNADNVESARRAAFDKKSKEFYCKFLSAVLVKKKEQNKAERIIGFDYQKYIMQNVSKYIGDLKDGYNNIAQHLHLADEKAAASLKDLIDDTAEKQIISVHHKIPVAAAVPLYVTLHPELHQASKMQELFKQLSNVCPQAVENRTPEDIVIIGLALNVFPGEAQKDNIAAIYKMSDEKKKAQALQVLQNKEVIRDLYQQYFPLNFADKKVIREEILRIVNDLANHTLPMGNVVHQKMEPNGNATISKVDDKIYINVQNTGKSGITTTDKINNATIFAAEYDIADLREIVGKLNDNFREGIVQVNPLLRNKDNQPQHQTVTVRCTLNLPGTGFMRRMRNILNTVQNVSPITYLRRAIGLNK